MLDIHSEDLQSVGAREQNAKPANHPTGRRITMPSRETLAVLERPNDGPKVNREGFVKPPPITSEGCNTLGDKLVALNATTCKWPIGNVGDPDFHFCMRHKDDSELPYCYDHQQLRLNPEKRDRGWVNPFPKE